MLHINIANTLIQFLPFSPFQRRQLAVSNPLSYLPTVKQDASALRYRGQLSSCPLRRLSFTIAHPPFTLPPCASFPKSMRAEMCHYAVLAFPIGEYLITHRLNVNS